MRPSGGEEEEEEEEDVEKRRRDDGFEGETNKNELEGPKRGVEVKFECETEEGEDREEKEKDINNELKTQRGQKSSANQNHGSIL